MFTLTRTARYQSFESSRHLGYGKRNFHRTIFPQTYTNECHSDLKQRTLNVSEGSISNPLIQFKQCQEQCNSKEPIIRHFDVLSTPVAGLVAPSKVKSLLPMIPAQENLSPYWVDYFSAVDTCIKENFWGNLSIMLTAKLFQDAYVAQMEEIGYSFEIGQEGPAPFYQSIKWVFQQIHKQIDSGQLTPEDVLWPAKVFECTEADGTKKHIFVPIGEDVPVDAVSLNLLTPKVFVSMLASGYFPIGEAIREHTNQTLAEHDLAHMAGFVSSPRFTKAIREAFRRILVKMETNPRILNTLNEFDSAYSLRLYYTIEVFTEIPKHHLPELQKLIEIPLDIELSKEKIVAFLMEKAKDPAKLYEYLHRIYYAFHRLVNPLGGESRDVLNRQRKFIRDGGSASFYDNVSQLSSKFGRNSLYSLYLNGLSALEYKRSNHPDFEKALEEIHASFIGALIGTSQLEIEDWVLECIEEVPNPDSKLYRYIHDSGLWSSKHLLLKAFCNSEYDKVFTS